MYAGFDYALDSWRIREHSNVTAEGTACLSIQGDHPDRRNTGDVAGVGGDHALRRLLEDREMAGTPRRTQRKSTW